MALRLATTPSSTAAFRTDILAIGGLQSIIAVTLIDEFERLPCTYGIAVSHDSIASAAFGTDILAIAGLKGHIAVPSIDEFERLPGTYCIAVSHDCSASAALGTDILTIGGTKGKCRPRLKANILTYKVAWRLILAN